VATSSWQHLLVDARADRHVVQLHRGDDRLGPAVAEWLAPAFASGGGALAACTPGHADLLRAALAARGHDPARLEASGRLVIVDAEEMLSGFLVDGMPHGAAFKRRVRGILPRLKDACAGDEPAVRAWGEMVDLLWQRGELAAVERLEELWNDAIAEHDFDLLCTYDLDPFSHETYGKDMEGICAGHARLLPRPDHERFEAAVMGALARLFGEDESRLLRALLEGRRRVPAWLPPAESVLVGLYDLDPQMAKRLLAEAGAQLAGDARA
jgi:hypothetical protein